ncbi:MAG: histidine kinase [Confluentimicrobium sp.]|jgi:HPt (histidine-containing phosphotransfer) domain-containing protein|uniref:Hpt domain-containing protein n=1 Tax=Actibacterium sp. TaxID=1872125 RepID=UPI00050E27E5|nr:Hpt domain-containing protein [Actibacterium sp.]KGB83735.1 histidine kinase [Rhodovulum sp. NI22]MBC57061.1 histidine kinase [Actibacterium sp.]|tara:strand:- start:8897 stop:9232 length:336 start_codon:yes stop_codon:yes gene_type:complete
MIDWNRIKELQGEVGTEAFAEVVELFLEEVEEGIGRLPRASSAVRLQEELHFLKGSALNLGFRQFAQLCHEEEQAAATRGPAAVDRVALTDCYQRSKETFSARLARLGAAA